MMIAVNAQPRLTSTGFMTLKLISLCLIADVSHYLLAPRDFPSYDLPFLPEKTRNRAHTCSALLCTFSRDHSETA